MSTTFTTALSTPTSTVINNNNNNNNMILKQKRTKLFSVFSNIYQYLAISCHFIYSALLFTYKTSLQQQQKKLTIPNNNTSKATQYYKNKTLVLDLDETLVHSVRLGSEAHLNTGTVNPSITRKKIEVQCDKQSLLYEVYKRPHVDFFLKTISQWYKVVIYTASMAEYAEPVIDWLDQDNNLIAERFFRPSCVLRNGNYLKDLTLAEPDLCKVCLVDNSPIAFDLYRENGIALPTWISNPTDESLLDLLPFLDALRFAADVRSVLRLQYKKK